MGIESILYYVGFVVALGLCRGLGPVFFYPMLGDLLFDVCGQAGLFTGWDIRPLMVTYGLAILVWVLVLTNALTKPTFVLVLIADLGAIFYRIVPQFQASGTGQDFWDLTSTGIYEIWLVSIFVIVASMAVRSSVVARMQGRRADLLTNPRKRFLLPIGAWAIIPPLAGYIQPLLSTGLYDARFMIAAQVLVWGWVGLELPAFLIHRRMMKRLS